MRAAKRKPGTGQARGLWDRPLVMNHVADILFFVSVLVLGYVAVMAALRLPFFPLREVTVVGPLQHVTQAQIEYAARSALTGNFFTVNLSAARAAFEKLPWVRHVQVRRMWPNGIELELEEHVAAGVWKQGESGESRLVNVQGEVFAAASNAVLPLLGGPQGSAPAVLARYRAFSELVAPLGRKPQSVMLSARLAWQLRLDDGLVVQLGRDQQKSPVSERLARFITSYTEATEKLRAPAATADLRYPNGFALKLGRGRIETKSKR